MTKAGVAMAADGWVAIDWGTTNRRVFRLDPAGQVVARAADGLGVTAVPGGGFPAAIAELRQAHGDVPFLLAGMVGSNRGWREAPYLPCPVTIPQLAAALLWVEPGRAAIVPGAAMTDGPHADVMRGEEVQLLGAAAAGLVAPDARLCLPGTHNKWATLAGGALAGFRTTMTGELFALLRAHSILAAQLDGAVADGEAFRAGVRQGLAHNQLLADLFGARARVLLGRMAAADSAAYVSGLLIGADLAIGLAEPAPGPVALIGAPALTALYAAAFTEAGHPHHQIDGEQAFLAGIAAITELSR